MAETLEEIVQRSKKKKPRHIRVQVLLTQHELEEIKSRAKQTDQSLSSFLRELGTREEMRSICDLLAIRELASANKELSRVAGLFKIWLLEIEDQEINTEEMRLMMLSFRNLQIRMSQIISKILQCKCRFELDDCKKDS
mgnify:CR=1 FL=1